jgi:predicted phosphate transport protein (TIGR00153 family)
MDALMFSSLMPQRREFFDLLTAHSDRVVAGANATLRLVNSLGSNQDDVAALVDEVNLNEKSADKIKGSLITLLHNSFTTPINRDQIHTLTLDLDNILDTLQDVANAIAMYHIKDSTPEAREMASLSADACMRLNRAVITLADKKRSQETIDLCKEIDQIESRADKVLRKAIAKLFQDGGDVWIAMKMREFYFLQEAVLDYCEEAAKTIEEILIENS